MIHLVCEPKEMSMNGIRWALHIQYPAQSFFNKTCGPYNQLNAQ